MIEKVADVHPERSRLPESFNRLPRTAVLQTLRLDKLQQNAPAKLSVLQSEWYLVGGKTVVEVRNPLVLTSKLNGMLYMSDFDDTMMQTTKWHAKEFEALAALGKTGNDLTVAQAKELYELSKMQLPGVTESCYQPEVNIALASAYSHSINEGKTIEAAWKLVLSERDRIHQALQAGDLQVLTNLFFDPAIIEAFISNPSSNFTCNEFITDFLHGTDPADVRIVSTRGAIEGPLGQVHKVHSSSVLEKTYSLNALDADSSNVPLKRSVDIVIYSTDLKADTIRIASEMLPQNAQNGIRFYDDNPVEVTTDLEWGRKHRVTNLEVIRVIHPKAKHASDTVNAEVAYTSTDPEKSEEPTRYEIYLSSPSLPAFWR